MLCRAFGPALSNLKNVSSLPHYLSLNQWTFHYLQVYMISKNCSTVTMSLVVKLSFEMLIQCIPLYSTLVKEFLKITFKYFSLDIVAIHDLSVQAVPFVLHISGPP